MPIAKPDRYTLSATTERLARHFEQDDERYARPFALAFIRGLRVAIQHPEWAQSIVQQDDEEIGPSEIYLLRLAAEIMVEAVP